MDYTGYKKANNKKLLEFGFKKENKNCYIYSTKIFNDEFELTVKIKDKIETKLVDTSTNEPYTLHLLDSADGGFVGQVKQEYENVLNNIFKNCFETSVFKNPQTLEIIKYAKDKYKNEVEYLWKKFPKNGILRHQNNQKWYAAILTVSKSKLGFEDDKIEEIIDLRAKNVSTIIDNKRYFAGYHMNKKNWITIILDGSADIDDIKLKLDESYNLTK